MYRAIIAVGLVVGLVVGGPVGALAAEGTAFREAVRGRGGVVASESPAASRVGLAVLDGGGNAVDAAAAMTFALGVARPQSCGIGGGGFMVYRGADGETAALDFRETAPAAVRPDTFTGDGLSADFTGHTTVGVPGTVAGMAAALDRLGTRSLAEAIRPAEGLARDGVEVQPSLSEAMADHAARLRLFPAAARQFLVDGERPYEAGDVLVQPDLADTLALIAEEGPTAFYEGEIADLIAADMREAGELPGDEGLMTRRDLAAYEAKFREPLRGDYRNHEVIAMPPPTSGGVALFEILNILNGFDLEDAGQGSADALHLIAEAQKIAFADRGVYVADPDFADVPTYELIDYDYAVQRRREIDPQKAGTYEPGDVGGTTSSTAGTDLNPAGSTTSLSVIDAEGNAVALTCTIEQTFGSAVVAPGTGFLLNNELTDFSEPGAANEPRPGKRPRSSISPTIVMRDGRPVLVVGGAGGSRIIMGSVLATINVADYGLDVARAVDAERLDSQSEEELFLENGRVSPVVVAELLARGHMVTREFEYGGTPRVQAVGIDPATGDRLATTDPRSGEDDYAALAQGVGMPEAGAGGAALRSHAQVGDGAVAGARGLALPR